MLKKEKDNLTKLQRKAVEASEEYCDAIGISSLTPDQIIGINKIVENLKNNRPLKEGL